MDLKYKQVIDYLLRYFSVERYKEGDKLPTESSLMKELCVGRNTIRKAITEMEVDGIVIRKQGSGTFYIGHKEEGVSKGGLVGLANFSGLGYIYPQIIRGIEDALYEEGFSLVVATNNMDSLRNISSLKMVLDQGVKGLIMDLSRNIDGEIETPAMELVRSVGIPVTTTHWSGYSENFSTVALDDEHGGYKAVKFLIDNGHRNIGIIYKSGVQAGILRYEGYVRALKEAGIPLNEEFISTFNEDIDGLDIEEYGVFCTNELLERTGNKLTAIFYFNDLIAIEGYKAINQYGLNIPDDISVIGFDNYITGASISPPLTTLDHPKEDLGYWAAKFLVNEIRGQNSTHPKKLIFEPSLIIRESVKKI
ncbi:GntR family transcriptional regulator [Thiospirochaeta perfilievii]|uniref:GntR family transcriptional regulator n=1 Tax=Thiospirochaeta perfilievii TaxID=252967 RepID=A0A5C1QBF7_9SPIO|nr:GntR family transcriptional regulator [Thiospirochaeta perfilievii]QEN04390.1 GntR family transcriptional regulator [Thiospirochaeta perfilievii]